MSRDPLIALENVIEKVDPLDVGQMGNPDDPNRLESEVMSQIGHENIDKDTLKYIAYYKALSDDMPEEILTKIEKGQLFESDLNEILSSKLFVEDI